MASIVFERTKEDWRVVYHVASVSLSLSLLEVADIVVIVSKDQLSFAVSYPIRVVAFVRETIQS